MHVYLFFCVWVFRLHFYLCTCMQCPWRPEEGFMSPLELQRVVSSQVGVRIKPRSSGRAPVNHLCSPLSETAPGLSCTRDLAISATWVAELKACATMLSFKRDFYVHTQIFTRTGFRRKSKRKSYNLKPYTGEVTFSQVRVTHCVLTFESKRQNKKTPPCLKSD